MPIVAVILVLAILLGLLVAALGPALKYAERRSGKDEDELDGLGPLEWQPVVIEGVVTRRFAPRSHPSVGEPVGVRTESERQTV